MLSDNIREIAGWLGLLGVPTIFMLICGLIKAILKMMKQIKILMQAQKAQMRSQLMDQYYRYEGRGYIYNDELEDWENQYQAYHELVGPNGVLDNKRSRILAMDCKPR